MENSWKFQLVIFLYQIIVWVALLLQPALEWDIAYGNTWYKWLQRAALFGWVGTAAESKVALLGPALPEVVKS